MTPVVTVAIPTLDAGPGFARTLESIAGQRLDAELELLICDSGSRDGTAALARLHGARVLQIERGAFSHGGTRNRLMAEASGAQVAFLTQDAVPAHSGWLAALLGGFALFARRRRSCSAPIGRGPDASVSVTRELTEWFASFGDDGPAAGSPARPTCRDAPREQRFSATWATSPMPTGASAGPPGSGCRFARCSTPRTILLAQDMLRAGYGKAYVPGAAVIPLARLQRLGVAAAQL